MEERTFDLTVPVIRQVRILWVTIAVLQIFCGLINISRGDTILGGLQLASGIIILPSGPLMQHLNRYVISLRDENVGIHRGLFRHRKIPWASISGIRIQLMSVEIQVKQGRREKIDFSVITYRDNQTVKPRMISALKAFAGARGIPMRDSQVL